MSCNASQAKYWSGRRTDKQQSIVGSRPSRESQSSSESTVPVTVTESRRSSRASPQSGLGLELCGPRCDALGGCDTVDSDCRLARLPTNDSRLTTVSRRHFQT